jgi:integrase
MKLFDCIDEYVAYRQSLGVGFHGEKLRLRQFGRFAGNLPVAEIKRELVQGFINGKGLTAACLTKHYTLAGLFRFAIILGYVQRSPMPTILPKPPPRRLPYIYSVPVMKRLLHATDERLQRGGVINASTFRTLLLLLYGTGLRISEALFLKIKDVDLDQQLLTVRETKFYKSRLVPIGDDVTGVLQRYRKCHHRKNLEMDQPFLQNTQAGPIDYQSAQLAFKSIREYIGLRRPTEFLSKPRLHDLRHTFAVNRLVTWYKEGKNVQHLLPHLSTYLGHRSIHETRRYLTFTSELSMEAGLRFLVYALPREKNA